MQLVGMVVAPWGCEWLIFMVPHPTPELQSTLSRFHQFFGNAPATYLDMVATGLSRGQGDISEAACSF